MDKKTQKKLYKRVFSEKTAKTDQELKYFCEKNNLKFNLVDLPDLKNNLNRVPKFSFVYTGSEEDEYNKGYTHHWLYLCGRYLFDSYGYQSHYNISDNIISIKTFPSQLQEYNSDVCGEYCAAFAYFCQQINNIDYKNLGVEFQNYYGFGQNKKQNDIKVLSWYDKKD